MGHKAAKTSSNGIARSDGSEQAISRYSVVDPQEPTGRAAGEKGFVAMGSQRGE